MSREGLKRKGVPVHSANNIRTRRSRIFSSVYTGVIITEVSFMREPLTVQFLNYFRPTRQREATSTCSYVTSTNERPLRQLHCATDAARQRPVDSFVFRTEDPAVRICKYDPHIFRSLAAKTELSFSLGTSPRRGGFSALSPRATHGTDLSIGRRPMERSRSAFT